MSTIFPRYQKTQKQFSSLDMIEQHAPHLLQQKEEKNIQNNQILSLEYDQQETKIEEDNRLFAPTVQLQGHGGEVLCTKFSPDGNLLASAGFDKLIFLWDVYKQCNNVSVLKGHKNAILELQWSTDGNRIYTASADKTVAVWDLESQKRIKKIVGHTGIVNSCHPARRGPDIVISGSDDCKSKIWDLRAKEAVHEFENKYAVTSVSFNDTAEKFFLGSLDNQIKVWDLRKKEVVDVFSGHTDTITGLSLSSDGSYLLSNSMDHTVKCWDIRPFVVGNRCVKIFQGHSHGIQKNLLKVSWSKDGLNITAGSADKYLYIWDTTSRKIMQKLGGHNGSINESVFSPKDKLIASGSSDRTVIIGEIPEYTL